MIEIARLRKRFGRVVAVDELSLAIKTGEIVGLLGPSGCGKTTALRCIAGLERPDGGSIHLDDVVLYSDKNGRFVPAERRQMGMVFQSYALWPHMTVRENVQFAVRYGRARKAKHARSVDEILELVGLSDLVHRYPAELSGGQQQRVALARAVVGSPTVVLFDEPLSNLDAQLRVRLRREIKVLVRTLGITAIYVTHDQREAMALCDRVAVMSEGKIRQLGAPEEIYRQPADIFVAAFAGESNVLPYVREGSHNEAGTVRLSDSLEVQLACIDSLGSRGHGVIRPEDLAIQLASDKGPAGWIVRVTERLFLGEYTEYVVRTVDGRVQLTVHSPNSSLQLGAQCVVNPDLGKVIWLPGEHGVENATPA